MNIVSDIFKPGDLVRLKSEGATMLVEMVISFDDARRAASDGVRAEPGVHCVWHDLRHVPRRAVYSPQVLIKEEE